MDSRGAQDSSSASCSKTGANKAEQRHDVDEHAQSEIFDDAAEVAQESSEDKARKITAQRMAAYEALDLDAIFGQKATELGDDDEETGPEEKYEKTELDALNLDAIFRQEATELDADDEETESEDKDEETELEEETEETDLEEDHDEENLEEEDKKPMVASAGPSTESANTATPKPAILRKYIPDDIADEVEECYNNLPSEYHEVSWRSFAWFYSTAQVEWKYMSTASRMLRDNGEYVPKRLEAADRSVDWLWENGRPADLVSPPSVPVVDEETEPEFPPNFHHLSFVGYPVYHKSSTPAEVSLWLTQTTGTKYIFPPFSREGVVTAQATKLIDPFVYYGPDELLEKSGTELRDAVVGRVSKAYVAVGTWMEDYYDDSDEIPTNADMVDTRVWQDGATTGKLQHPYWVTSADHDVVTVNDERGQRAIGKWPIAYTPSRLRLIAEREAAEAAAREELREAILDMKPFLVKKFDFDAPTEEAMLGMKPFLVKKFDFDAPPEEAVEEQQSESGEEPKPCFEFDYKPIAKAVGRGAFQLAKWLVSSQFIW